MPNPVDPGEIMAAMCRAALLSGLLMLAIGRAASAETLLLTDGSSIDGKVVSATGTTLGLKIAGGGFRQLRRQDLAEVRLILEGQAEVQGAFARWANGVYSLEIDGRSVEVQDGRAAEEKALKRGGPVM
ncbi:MAG: hypothetical protein HC871_05725 [Rhizobiales bacterium]|nr:hypothetical protein [Hyphomicrobiales bacterium]